MSKFSIFRWIPLVLLMVGVTPVAFAEAPAPVNGPIAEIVIAGNRRIEADTILAAITLHKGETVSSARIRRDLKAVYASGWFDDVQIGTEVTEAGVVVTFTVVEKPAVREVKLVGNKKIDEDDLREAIDVGTFAVLSEAEVKRNVNRLRDLYIEKGYYLAEVEPRTEVVADGLVDLVFEFREGRKVLVQRVDITGNENLPASKIKRFLQTREAGIVPWLTGRGSFKQESVDTDPYIIQQLYREEGYVDAEVSSPKIYLSPDKRFISVSFHVTEGPKYEIGEIHVEGDFIPEDGLTEQSVLEIVGGRSVYDIQYEQWREALGKKPRRRLPRARKSGQGVKAGDTFRLTQVQTLVQYINDFYSDRGYAFVNVVPIPNTNPETKTVDLTFAIDKGDKVHIGRINITGNDPTFDKVVRREIPINEGELYRGSLIRGARARLERLGYFETVNIATPRGEAPGLLDLNVSVTEKPTGTFNVGLGFSTLEQLMLTANIAKSNFLGLGYNFSLAVNYSRYRQQFNFSISDPYFLDTRWTFSFNGYWISRQYQLDEYQRGGTVAIGRYVDARDDMQLSLEYTLEDVGLTSLDPYRRRLLGGELFRNGLTSKIGLSFSVDKRNNRQFATKGVFFSAALNMAGGFRTDQTHVLSMLGGDFNFVETQLNFRLFQPLIPKSDALVFRLNSSIGAIWSTDGRPIPYIHRYRAGGINSVRGYDWYSLGPSLRVTNTEDPIHGDDQMVIGGNQSWINNFELEAPIVRSAGILGVVFFDAGNAFGDPWGEGNLNPAKLRFSAGAGIRWRSPMGPLRFELGFPIAPEEGERRSVFDFSIGSFF